MSVIGEFLGFDGTINRIGYVWRAVVVSSVLTGAAALATWALANLLHPGGMLDALDARHVVMGALLLALWSSFALGARRLRDMGLEPTHIVPFYAALWVCDAMVLAPLSRLDPVRYGALENAWRIIAVVIVLPLLLWPPRRTERRRPSIYDEAPPHTAYLNWREGG